MNTVTGTGALAKLAARRDRLMLPAWLYLLTATLASTGYSFRSLYPTPASREAVYHSTVHNPTLLGLDGPLYGDSVGALTTWKVGSIAAVLAALMSIFIVIRHTRADEEAGRLELIGSTAVGRHSALAVGLILAAVANVVLALLITVALIAVGLPAAGSAALGLAIAGCGLVFTAVAAVTAQVSGTARGARGIAIAALAVAYLCGVRLRGGGRAVAGLAVPDRLGQRDPGLRRRTMAGARAAGAGCPGPDRRLRCAGRPA